MITDKNILERKDDNIAGVQIGDQKSIVKITHSLDKLREEHNFVMLYGCKIFITKHGM